MSKMTEKWRTKERSLTALKWLSYKFLPVIFWLSLIFGFDKPYIAVLTVISALIHEAGHIAAIMLFTKRAEAPRGHISGFRIKRSSQSGHREEILITAAGPLANILTGLVLLLPWWAANGYILIFSMLNFATGLSNLLPVEGYDGYGILLELSRLCGSLGAERLLSRISFLFTVLFTFFSLYLLLRTGGGYWIFGVFFTLMLTKVADYGKFEILRE